MLLREHSLVNNHRAHKQSANDPLEYDLIRSSFRHTHLGTVSSTSDICFDEARNGAESGLWVLADRQTGGRGRRGRTWVSEPGNFYASLLLVDSGAADLSILPLAFAVSVARAIDNILPSSAPKTHVKWPNDILIEGQKICGMLLEVEALKNGQRATVLGCGINMAHHPDHALYPTCATSNYGAGATPAHLLPHVMDETANILDLWDSGKHISAIRKLWVEKAAGIGQEIEVRLPNDTHFGRFVGLADDGQLILKREDGTELLIAAGDVFLSRSAS